MKKILLLLTILFISVMSTACINNLAIQELNNKAVNYMDKGDAQTAICRLKSSLDLDNDIYQTHYNLAVAYNSIGEYQNAIDELDKVITLNPEFIDSYYTIAVAKESLAYKVLEDEDADYNENTPSKELMMEFNDKALEAVEAYNQYLAKNPNSKEEESINSKINELNTKIKEFTESIENAENTSSEDALNKDSAQS